MDIAVQWHWHIEKPDSGNAAIARAVWLSDYVGLFQLLGTVRTNRYLLPVFMPGKSFFAVRTPPEKSDKAVG